MINDLVCEGCGDCSIESNCLSVEPLETPLGRKRKINLSTCNKDFSCLNGFCPSFVTVEGGARRKQTGARIDMATLMADIAAPELPPLEAPFDLLVTGVGGTGVVTVGALITMAAHLEGRGASVLDFTGFAQKFGTVLSYIRLSASPDALHQVRIDPGAADAVIGCDIVVSSAPKASAHYRPGSRVVLNRAEMPTGDLVLRRDAQLKVDEREVAIRQAVGDANVWAIDANDLAETLMGDAVFANVMMLGFAWQRGLVPVSELSLQQAILLNGVAVEKNRTAFDLGRVMAAKPGALQDHLKPQTPKLDNLDDLIAHRAAFLTDYQNSAYADRYRHILATLPPEMPDAIRKQAARSLFKLMAFKDEYEVARLHTQTGFQDTLKAQFEGDFKVHYHMAPPLLGGAKDTRGRPGKRKFGPWMTPFLKGLAGIKGLRGTPVDLFRYGHEGRMHRDTLAWYENILTRVSTHYSAATAAACADLIALPNDIRGYGPVRAQAIEQAKAASVPLLTVVK